MNFRIESKGLVIALTIILIPNLIYTHLFFSEQIATINFLGYNYQHGHLSNQVYSYVILAGLVPIILLSIWYLQCIYWWRKIIIFCLFCWIDNVIRFKFSNKENLQLFIYSIIITIILYLILQKIIKFSNNNTFKDSFETINLISVRKDYKYISNLNVFNYRSKPRGDREDFKKLIELDYQISKLVKKFKRRKPKYSKKIDFTLVGFLVFSVTTLYWDYYFFYKFPLVFKVLEFTKEPFGFIDMEALVYILSTKVAILFPLLIWFFTSNNWWRYALFSPIILNTYQLGEIFTSETKIDESSFYYALPCVLITISIILYLDSKVNYANYILKVRKNVKNKLDEIINSVEYTDQSIIKDQQAFDKIKKSDLVSNKTKLEELIKMREELLKRIN